MHRPAFGSTTLKDQTVYRIDYETTEADSEGQTEQMGLASPAAESVRLPPPPAPASHPGHAFADETLPLPTRR